MGPHAGLEEQLCDRDVGNALLDVGPPVATTWVGIDPTRRRMAAMSWGAKDQRAFSSVRTLPRFVRLEAR